MNSAVPTFRSAPVRKIRKKPRFHKLSMRFSFFRRHQYVILLRSGISAGIILLFCVIRRGFRGSHTRVTQVEFDQQSSSIFTSPQLEEKITAALMWKSSLICRLRCSSEVYDTLIQDYPFLKDVTIRRPDTHTLRVSTEFEDPRLVFQLQDRKRASYNQHLVQLSPTLTRGQNITPLYLPRYLESLTGLDGIFFESSEDELVQALSTIRSTLRSDGVQAITYIPGWEKLLIEYDTKSFYVDLSKDIDMQLAKLIDIELYYEDYQYLLTIDLGSSEYAIVK